MSREDWACIGLMILGILLFLYGANFYNTFVGWTGVFLFILGFFVLIALAVYNYLKGKPESETPPPPLQNP